MSKTKTALQRHIQYLEKMLKQCQPMAPMIPALVMCINNAKDELKKERQQIEDAWKDGNSDTSLYCKPELSTSNYFTSKYGDNG